ncbi:MAG TPA: peptidylprolyl isomerase [Candidatus Acidoferrales bacterium]|nr:peptidylprolyl isomerase [Candidatus Acidoferrales bacterium]
MSIRFKSCVPAFLCLFISLASFAQTPSPAPAKKPAAPAKAPAAKGPFDPALLQPATLRANAPAEYEVKFVTTAGDFTIKVTRAWAPNGADRFYNLVRHHFYDGAAFFRVISGFMAQFGLSAYPEVSKVWENANIKDDPVVQSNHRGFITFAQSSALNSRSTQVFINFGNNEALDRDRFAPFGVVTDGMEVVDKLYSGYGEGAPQGRGPDQELVGTRGRAYLEKSFPKLDSIRSATLVSPAAAPAPAQ